MIKINKWTEKEEDFIIQNHNKLHISKICKELNRSKNSVSNRIRWLKSKGIIDYKFYNKPIIYEKFGKDKIDFIKKYYPKYGWNYCSEKLNIEVSDIRNIVAQLGLNRKIPRKFVSRTFDFDKFIKFHPISVYLLGFIWGDGHVNKNQRTIRLAGVYSDFVSIAQLFTLYGNPYICEKNLENRQRQLEIIIRDNNLFNFLVENDYLFKKDYNADKILSVIPQELHKYWFRGFFDADGHITFEETETGAAKRACFSLSSSFGQDWSFVTNLFDRLNIINYIVYKHEHKGNKGKFSAIRIEERKEIIKFLDYIYASYNLIGFPRKYLKYIALQEHLEYQKENHYYFNHV